MMAQPMIVQGDSIMNAQRSMAIGKNLPLPQPQPQARAGR